MFAEGFVWGHALDNGGPCDSLFLEGVLVARLDQRVDDARWFVVLDRHLDWQRHQHRRVLCRSYESGRQGTETWALRHQVRLRIEVAAEAARRTRARLER